MVQAKLNNFEQIFNFKSPMAFWIMQSILLIEYGKLKCETKDVQNQGTVVIKK